MKITAECPNCRFIAVVSPTCLLLELGDTEDGDGSSVCWICQLCNEFVALPVDLATIIDLACAGASVLASDSAQLGLTHPENASGGPALTRDDLLEFHQCLGDDAWLAAMLSSESP